tara:strand:- start:356 stop:544 length:189 start_codon:yes stop_codon:yes gene_type:complete
MESSGSSSSEYMIEFIDDSVDENKNKIIGTLVMIGFFAFVLCIIYNICNGRRGGGARWTRLQ